MRKTYLRTDETMQKYIEHEKKNKDVCFFCFSDSEKTFRFWKMKKNKFPYDKIAEDHMMISPYEHVADREHLMPAAKIELEKIIRRLEEEKYFDVFFENFKKNRTILDHYHIH